MTALVESKEKARENGSKIGVTTGRAAVLDHASTVTLCRRRKASHF
jgi:hypothetical protein